MTILRAHTSRTKPRDPTASRRSSDLTSVEQNNVRAVLRFLRTRLGGLRALAKAMGTRPKTIENALSPRGAVSAGVALRSARAAGVPVDAVLAGAWPLEGACPHCGQGGSVLIGVVP